jgi:hypothetical protein
VPDGLLKCTDETVLKLEECFEHERDENTFYAYISNNLLLID